jgi:hypothetical protein
MTETEAIRLIRQLDQGRRVPVVKTTGYRWRGILLSVYQRPDLDGWNVVVGHQVDGGWVHRPAL